MGYRGKTEEEMVDNSPLDLQSLPRGGSAPTQQVFLVRWSNRCRGLKNTHEIGYMHALSVTGVQSGVRGQWAGRG